MKSIYVIDGIINQIIHSPYVSASGLKIEMLRLMNHFSFIIYLHCLFCEMYVVLIILIVRIIKSFFFSCNNIPN